MNLENSQVEVIKILRTEDKVTAIGYGPYDNGYLTLGLKSGYVLIFDVVSLERIAQIQLFSCSPVTTITHDPTNLIMIGSQNGEIASIAFIQKELHYVYLEIGKRQYCTIALSKDKGENGDLTV